MRRGFGVSTLQQPRESRQCSDGWSSGKDGEALVILLGGGTKKRQGDDIAEARDRWTDYKKRKAQET